MMPRRTVPLYPNQYYHLYNRGNNRGRIFFEDENYLFFLRKMHRYLLSVFDIVAYCLMPTHYHFLVRVKKPATKTSEVSETSEVSSAAVSKAMMRFSVSYTKAINKRFGRVGALFQGAYQAKRVEEESYLLHLSRYVHLNPVAAGLARAPSAWPFSSYRDFIRERTGRLPNPDVVLSYFESPDAYRRFVEDHIRQSDGEAAWKKALFE